jgi:hypothetical protein
MNNLLTEEIIRKEVYDLTKLSRYDYHVHLGENILEINGKYVQLRTSDLCMSLDDFSERVIKPLLGLCINWDKAFNPKTWGIRKVTD